MVRPVYVLQVCDLSLLPLYKSVWISKIVSFKSVYYLSTYLSTWNVLELEASANHTLSFLHKQSGHTILHIHSGETLDFLPLYILHMIVPVQIGHSLVCRHHYHQLGSI